DATEVDIGQAGRVVCFEVGNPLMNLGKRISIVKTGVLGLVPDVVTELGVTSGLIESRVMRDHIGSLGRGEPRLDDTVIGREILEPNLGRKAECEIDIGSDQRPAAG